MDILPYVAALRNEAALLGDYGAYRKQLRRRVLTLRRKLGRATPKGRKFASKAPITVQEVSNDVEFAHLILLDAERAWAQALQMKNSRSAESSDRAATGTLRKHMQSKFAKAIKSAAHLETLLGEEESSSGSKDDGLAAGAYRSLLQGSRAFESQRWKKCLGAYADAYTICTAIAKRVASAAADSIRGLLAGSVEQSIRYAAYQLGHPRTESIPKIVSKHAQKKSRHIKYVLEIDPTAFEDEAETNFKKSAEGKDLPKTITWKSRTVDLEDAAIAQALASVAVAEKSLTSFLVSADGQPAKAKAAAYDEILNASQDAVDATRSAIEEMSAQGVAPGDPRMQSLQVTRTAVNYASIGRRIGRNRTLCGAGDGVNALKEESQTLRSKKHAKNVIIKPAGTGRKLARLRELVALYENTLQNLESIKELPGVLADQTLTAEVDRKVTYFKSLRCLALGRAHALLGDKKSALALFARGHEVSKDTGATGDDIETGDKPLEMELTQTHITTLKGALRSLTAQYGALVEMGNLQAEAIAAERAKAVGALPLGERLDEYPVGGADLTNLVAYPPRMRPVPVKPIFLDVAWNYIQYPDPKQEATDAVTGGAAEPAEKKEARRGWFGFGR